VSYLQKHFEIPIENQIKNLKMEILKRETENLRSEIINISDERSRKQLRCEDVWSDDFIKTTGAKDWDEITLHMVGCWFRNDLNPEVLTLSFNRFFPCSREFPISDFKIKSDKIVYHPLKF